MQVSYEFAHEAEGVRKFPIILCCGNVAGRGSGRHKDGEAGRLREGAGLQYEDRGMRVSLALVFGTLGLALGVMEVLESRCRCRWQ